MLFRSSFLTESLNLGCFDEYKQKYKLEKPSFGQFKNGVVFVFFEGQEFNYAFDYNFNIYRVNKGESNYVPEDQKWKCPGKYCNTDQRKNFVKELMDRNPKTYSYKPTTGKSTKIDLSDDTQMDPTGAYKVGNSTIFPKKGLCFIFQTSLGQEEKDRKSTRLNSSHSQQSRMPSSA